MSLNRPSSMEYRNCSGVVSPVTADEPHQVVFEYNPRRIGLDFQNQGTHDMYLVIHLVNALDAPPIRYRLTPGEYWYKDQFAPINQVSIEGVLGEPFAASDYGL